MYEKIIADFKKELHAANQNLVDSKKSFLKQKLNLRSAGQAQLLLLKI